MDFFYTQKFQALVEARMKRHHTPGIAIAIVQDDEIKSAGFGLATVDPPVPCTADTLFDIASCSKSLTAASVALLARDEAHPTVQWEAPMSKMLPDDFVMSDPKYTAEVTLDDIIGHRSGMPRHDSSYLGIHAAQPDDARSVTRNLRNLPLSPSGIRSAHIYCNIMYTVATHLVEVVSQQSFADFLQHRFFDPLGMESTCLQPQAARERGLGDRIATGHCWQKKKGYKQFSTPDCPEAQGAGSIMTSVNDFIRYVKALLNQEGPITERVYHDSIRLRSIPNPNTKWLRPYTSSEIYAAGLEIYWYRGHMVVGHSGSVPGFGGYFFFLPSLKFGGCIFGNSSEGSTVPTIIAREMIDEVLGVPEDERRHKKGQKSSQVQNLAIDEQKKAQSMSEQDEKDKRPPTDKKKNKEEREMQTTDLSAYTGDFWHAGYHTLRVQIEDGKLFIDASDRSMGFALTFDHVSGQTKYIAHLSDVFEEGDEPLDAEFEFKDGQAVRMGIDFEYFMDGMIWFDRVRDPEKAQEEPTST